MLKVSHSQVAGPAEPSEARGPDRTQFDLATLLRLLRRNRRSTALIVLGALALGLLYVLTATPLYLAASQVLIDARRTRIDPVGAGGSNLSLAELGMDPASVDSQVEVLRSEGIALDVLRRLRLASDPGFTTPTSLPGRFAALFRRGGSGDGSEASGDGVPAEVLETFAKRLDVRRVTQTYVIAVSYYDPSPARAAAVVNAVTAAYLQSQLHANSEAVQHTGAWLKQRIGEVRAEAAAADQTVQRFKAEHGILDTGTGLLVSEAQMNELSSALIKARADSAQMEAREAQLRRVIGSGDPAAGLDASFGDEALGRLREQYAAAARREADITRRFGSDHVTAQSLRGEMQEINRLIMDALRRIADAGVGSLAIARAREASLEKSVAAMGSAAGTTNAAQVTLRGLERDLDGLKTLYQGLVSRYNTSLQQQSFPVSEARILAEARPPVRRNYPNTLLIVALSALGGLAAAVAAAVLRELADRSLRLPHQIEASLGLPFLGVLPDLSGARADRSAAPAGTPPARRPAILDDPAARPPSAFADTLRAVQAEVDARTYHDGTRIVGIVSTYPGEGTSTVAANLAALAARTGRRVLLIDAAPTRAPAPANAAVPPANDRGFDVITARNEALPPTGDPVHGSARLGDILAKAKHIYDDVIVDLPPLASGGEIRALAPLIGAFVLVVAWGRTERATAAEALRAVPLVHERGVGAVLNRTDMNAFRAATQGTADAFYAPRTGGVPA